MSTDGLYSVVGLFLLLYIHAGIFSAEKTYEKDIPVPDKSFPSGMSIYGLNVTCDKQHTPGTFRSQTWTCKNMKVGGVRMAYGLYPSFLTSRHKCTETRGYDELAEVCRAMMKGIDVKKPLWAALASNATCEHLDEKRIMLNMTKAGGYRWDIMEPGNGWIDTIQCMAVRTKNMV